MRIISDLPLIIERKRIPIVIDVSFATSNDQDAIKQKVCSIVERKNFNREMKELSKSQVGTGNPPPPNGEPEELSYLYHWKKETFQKYLRWYDWRDKKKFPFRIIRILENNSPEERDRRAAALENKEKFPKIGTSVTGERTIKRGVMLIYEAIHRTPFSPQEKNTLVSRGGEAPQYECLEHKDNNCPADCWHLKEYMKKYFPDFDDTNNAKEGVDVDLDWISF